MPLSNFGNEQFGDDHAHDALTHSVNTVWAQVGEKLGKNTMYKYMNRFGFDRKPPIDLPAGRDARERRLSNERQAARPADAIDIGRVAIGQERLR